LAVNKFLNQ